MILTEKQYEAFRMECARMEGWVLKTDDPALCDYWISPDGKKVDARLFSFPHPAHTLNRLVTNLAAPDAGKSGIN